MDVASHYHECSVDLTIKTQVENIAQTEVFPELLETVPHRL